MKFPALVRRRTVWLPTWLGGCILFAAGLAPLVFWGLAGERFLSADREVPHDVLIVEGWIREEPIQGASLEFLKGGYRYVVATGGYTGERWTVRRWSDAEIAREGLLRSGVPPEKVVFAQAPDAEASRTFSTAMAAKQALDEKDLIPKAVTVYTRGAHARRSRLVYQKVFGPTVQVGVISWKPQGSESEPWWRNSSRAEDFVKETAGCFWEWLFDSGRFARKAQT